MAKLTTTAQNIEYLLQDQQNYEFTKEEKKRIKEEYREFIKEYIKIEIIQSYEYKNLQNPYEYLLLNSDEIIAKLIQEIKEESEKRKIFVDNDNESFKKVNNDKWEIKGHYIYLWDNFDIEEDTEELYFKILEQVNKKYNLIDKTKEHQVIQRLEEYLISFYSNYPYYAVHKALYDKKQDEIVAQEIGQTQKEIIIILNNYYKVLNKIDTTYKKVANDQTQITIKQSNNKKRNSKTGLIFGVSFASGLVNGFKKAIK